MLFPEGSPASLTDSVVEEIKGIIIKQELKPGHLLPSERRLCQLFGVSRTVLREANRRLTEIGILEIRPGRGCFVKRISQPFHRAMDFLVKSGEATLDDLIEIRRVLETEAVRLAVQRASQHSLAEVQQALANFERADDESAIQADQRFHIAIANATGNPLFAFVLDALNDLLRGLRMKTLSVPKGREMALKTHRGVVEAIRRRDAGEAQRMIRAHLDHAEELLRRSNGRFAGKRRGHLMTTGATREQR